MSRINSTYRFKHLISLPTIKNSLSQFSKYRIPTQRSLSERGAEVISEADEYRLQSCSHQGLHRHFHRPGRDDLVSLVECWFVFVALRAGVEYLARQLRHCCSEHRVRVTCLASVVTCIARVVTCIARVVTCIARVVTCLARVVTCLVRVVTCIARVVTCIARVVTCLARVVTCLVRVVTCLARVVTCLAREFSRV